MAARRPPRGVRAQLDLTGAIGRADLCAVELLHTVRTGEAAFPQRYGQGFWADLAARPEVAASFDAAMGAQEVDELAAAYDWAALGEVVDVGGGDGTLLIGLLRAHPGLRGAVVDLRSDRHRRRGAGRAGLADRGRAVPGTFFDPLPGGAGGYVLSRVIHDWSDADAGRILANCAKAAGPGGRVIVVEEAAVGGAVDTGMDLRMLAYCNGRERTVGPLVELARGAGLRAGCDRLHRAPADRRVPARMSIRHPGRADRRHYSRAAPPGEADAMLELTDLTKKYGEITALDGVSLTRPRGREGRPARAQRRGQDHAAVDRARPALPDSGTARLLGRPPRETLAAGRVGVLLQDAGLPEEVKVADLVAAVAGMYPTPSPLDLGDLAERRVMTLSGGQRQLVRFALALAGDPELLILDEPTVGLDVDARRALWRQVQDRTVVFATHYLAEADDHADRVVLLSGGRIVADGPVEEIKALVGGTEVRLTLDAMDVPGPARAPPAFRTCVVEGRRPSCARATPTRPSARCSRRSARSGTCARPGSTWRAPSSA